MFTDAENNQKYRSYGLRAPTIQLSANLLGKSLTEVTGETKPLVDLMHPSKTAAVNVPALFASRFKTLAEKGLAEAVKVPRSREGRLQTRQETQRHPVERCRQSGTGQAFAGRAEKDGDWVNENS